MVVPEHHLVAGPFWAATAAHQSQNVTAEKHLNYTDAPIQVSDELASEGDRIVNAEATLGAYGEAILLLVKPNVANLIRASRSRHSHYFLLYIYLF